MVRYGIDVRVEWVPLHRPWTSGSLAFMLERNTGRRHVLLLSEEERRQHVALLTFISDSLV